MGMEVDPMLQPVMAVGTLGAKWPSATPTAMATKIHRVRKRSRKDKVVGQPGDVEVVKGLILLLLILILILFW